MTSFYDVKVVRNSIFDNICVCNRKVGDMKKLWSAIKRSWRNDEHDNSVYHLSQSDKRNLWYGVFMACLVTVGLSSFVIAFSNIRVSRKNSEDMEVVIEMIATYMGSATQDEYEKIAKTIRNDLVFSEYGQDIEKYIQYIPNTAKICRICSPSFLSQVYLVCTNTGQPYELDLFEKGENPDEGKYGGTSMSFGYDEVSGSSLHITKTPGNKRGSVTVQRKRGIVSVQRMKSLFCDDCIRKILEAVENQLVEEFVIFDAGQKKFYSLDDGEMRIGDYTLWVRCDNGAYEIEIEYAEEKSKEE